MPGHSLAALSAYPIMSCDPSKTYKVAETWGVFNDVYCPTDTTFAMLYSILDEVIDLFPGPYIHVGGDECPKDAWKASAYCQKLIRDSGLHDENGLQSYFIRKIERHINSKGKRIIGWDEILEGGLAPKATVMSWRGEEGGIAAAKQHHQVIMTPGSAGLYFDHAQSLNPEEPLSIGGNAPFSKTYEYDPVPASLGKEEQKYVVGVQANLWTEYISTEAKAEYMLLPRMLALAEVAWSYKVSKNYKDMSNVRLPAHLLRLENKGYNFRVPDLLPFEEKPMVVDEIPELKAGVKGGSIYYTLDGCNPRETDQKYQGPIKVNAPEGRKLDFKALLITAGGKRSLVTSLTKQGNK
jgi:hexosaminidase